MHAPRLIVIARPPGSDKSSLFPFSETGLDSFNADDMAAELNSGSKRLVPGHHSGDAGPCGEATERFIADHMRDRNSFAFEATRRTDITFRRADHQLLPPFNQV
jgi:predicted ABC-type ATPase